MAKKSRSTKRTRVAPRGDARFVRRTSSGRFKESDDVGKAQTRDRSTKAKRKVRSGQGDKGDR